MNFIILKMKEKKFLKVNVSINIPEKMSKSNATITGNFITDSDLLTQQPTLVPL